jgi:hypothetical protein
MRILRSFIVRDLPEPSDQPKMHHPAGSNLQAYLDQECATTGHQPDDMMSSPTEMVMRYRENTALARDRCAQGSIRVAVLL